MFEIVYDDDGRTTDGRRLDGYPISSPCEPNGSGELKMEHALRMCVFFPYTDIFIVDTVKIQPIKSWILIRKVSLKNIHGYFSNMNSNDLH